MKKFCETLKFILFLDFHAAMLAASYTDVPLNL